MSPRVAEIPELGSEHAGAICEEIGARLACILRPTGSDLPPRLAELMYRLSALDHEAPSTVPSIEEIDAEDARWVSELAWRA